MATSIGLSWRNLRAELVERDSRRVLLDSASGDAAPGRVLAVIGPSGSGKTTLLHMLAGRLEATRKVHCSGSLSPVPSAAAPASFVHQDDYFHSRLTVTEVINFAAALRLPPSTAAKAATTIIRAMGLQDVASSVVGGGKVRGISGGERKRLAIGCELCVASAASAGLFADEPTSGLDSFQALRIVQALQSAATNGRRVVALSMHQPSARLLECVDDVLLLGAGGTTLYIGPVAGMIRTLERNTGTEQPRMLAPAEWALELASIEPQAEEESGRLVAALATAWRAQRSNPPPVAAAPAEAVFERAAVTVQLRWCLWRAWRQATASMGLLAMRTFGTLMTGVVFGMIFWQLPLRAIKARVGLLQVLANFAAMTATLRSVRVLQDGEAAVVRRERAAGKLRLAPYFIGKVLAELPLNLLLPALLTAVIHHMTGLAGPLPQMALLVSLETVAANALGFLVGASAPSLDVGLEAAKAIGTIATVFGGLYFDEGTLPWVLRWMPRASLVRLTWDGTLCYEMNALGALKLKGMPPAAKLIADQGVKSSEPGDVAWELFCIACTLYTLAFCALAARAPRFQRLSQGSPGAKSKSE